MLERIRDVLPAIAERARDAEESRRLPVETVADLVSAGAFRMLQPERFGGLEGDPAQFYEVVREVSAVCGSTGWVLSVLGVHPWHVGLFPGEAQEEVWADGPDALICSSYAPIGRLRAVGGGCVLNGRWSFASGCDHASWALLGGLVVGDGGRPLDFLSVLVPREDFQILDVWDPVGLRGTGSNDVVVDEAFVPDHRIVRNYDIAQLRGPGRAVNRGPLYAMPFGAVFTTAVAAPVVGVVAGSYAAYVSVMRDRVRLSLGGGRFVEDQGAQVAVARAASEIDAAVLQLDRNITELYDHAVRGAEIPVELRLRTRRDQVRATERAVGAIDLLFQSAGGNSLRRGNPVERAWRDAHAGSMHVANDAQRALALYGKGEFDLPVEDTLV
ncbi:3-hydroxy-9,10-secoandrosta-1,3,5(10)-triene-9,17-dione monooxygenase oxygenase subunit [Saccharopolyspora kobensis]|uniref:3-hydroxy-9,10-secoandrosta-1,3,5(10)-triene-9, 17-dione monooxygenase oxygenase subunit n=1 Tax=Saccharopolyspora kobensis TaxID=146035 RepID=UPI001F481262|nr:3-hydroxy-9,10-secoandrosta-1,3,5(10)-triene-9,17-dione monooxygenase oxygenase subunit [Saccharopolyspora kobensis]